MHKLVLRTRKFCSEELPQLSAFVLLDSNPKYNIYAFLFIVKCVQ